MVGSGTLSMLTKRLRWLLRIAALLLVLMGIALWLLIPPNSRDLADRIKQGMSFTEVDVMLLQAGFIRGSKDQNFAQWHQERAGYTYGFIEVFVDSNRRVTEVRVNQGDEPPLIDILLSQVK